MVDTPATVGQPAPAFTLSNQHGQKISLTDLKGRWVVLYSYPKDDTPGCTKEACQFTSAMNDFADLNAVVLGVSADSPADHLAFIQKFDLKIDLLSDQSKQMLQSYGLWQEKQRDGKSYMGVDRQTFVIDPQGNLAFHWPKVEPDGHADTVRKKLAALASP